MISYFKTPIFNLFIFFLNKFKIFCFCCLKSSEIKKMPLFFTRLKESVENRKERGEGKHASDSAEMWQRRLMAWYRFGALHWCLLRLLLRKG